MSNPITGQKTTNFASHVLQKGNALTAYGGIITTSTTADSQALASGINYVSITNIDTTAANYIKVAFGDTAANAEANVSSGDVVRANSEKVFEVPDGATYVGYVAAAGTPAIALSQRG